MSSISANWAGRDVESLLWLASYPRSGNTFTRVLLANYFAAGEDSYDINRLHDFMPPDTSKPLWEDFTRDHPIAGQDGIWKARLPFIEHYRGLEKATPLPALKTHTANVEALGAKGFQFRKNDRVIYIVRHPLDVVLSYSDYNGRDLDFAIQSMCKSGSCVQHKNVGVVEVRGSWAEHVLSWLNTAECSVLLVRYEDLRGNTAQVLKSMLEFLGSPVIPERLGHAVEASHFDRMQAQEAAHRFTEAPETIKSGTFFRKGQSFQWLRELTPDQAYRLADGCEPIMSKLGYTHPRDVFYDGRNALQPIHLQS